MVRKRLHRRGLSRLVRLDGAPHHVFAGLGAFYNYRFSHVTTWVSAGLCEFTNLPLCLMTIYDTPGVRERLLGQTGKGYADAVGRRMFRVGIFFVAAYFFLRVFVWCAAVVGQQSDFWALSAHFSGVSVWGSGSHAGKSANYVENFGFEGAVRAWIARRAGFVAASNGSSAGSNPDFSEIAFGQMRWSLHYMLFCALVLTTLQLTWAYQIVANVYKVITTGAAGTGAGGESSTKAHRTLREAGGGTEQGKAVAPVAAGKEDRREADRAGAGGGIPDASGDGSARRRH